MTGLPGQNIQEQNCQHRIARIRKAWPEQKGGRQPEKDRHAKQLQQDSHNWAARMGQHNCTGRKRLPGQGYQGRAINIMLSAQDC
jgi:hypothetical protein